MYRTIVILGLLLLAMTLPGTTAPADSALDAMWWSDRSHSEKEVAVESAINGYYAGYQSGVQAVFDRIQAVVLDEKSKLSLNQQELLTTAMIPRRREVPEFPKPVLYYVQRIDAFYSQRSTDHIAKPLQEIIECLPDHAPCVLK